VTRPIGFDVTYGGWVRGPSVTDRIGFEARAHLDRRDFGLGWESSANDSGDAVDDRAEITICLTALR